MILFIAIFQRIESNSQPRLLTSGEKLQNFYFHQKPIVRETCLFICRNIAERIPDGHFQLTKDFMSNSEQLSKYQCLANSLVDSNLIGTLITDRDYPPNIAFKIVNNFLNNFKEKYSSICENTIDKKDLNLKLPEIQELLEKYQNPNKFDKIMGIKCNLDETQKIMIKSVEQILENGEKLENLMAKSQDLSQASLNFYKKSRKLNRCCMIL